MSPKGGAISIFRRAQGYMMTISNTTSNASPALRVLLGAPSLPGRADAVAALRQPGLRAAGFDLSAALGTRRAERIDWYNSPDRFPLDMDYTLSALPKVGKVKDRPWDSSDPSCWSCCRWRPCPCWPL